MSLNDHEPLEPSAFNGFFDRGENVKVPEDHFILCNNYVLRNNQLETRDGVQQSIATVIVARTYNYQRTGEAPRLLVLEAGTGKLFDASVSMTVPILTIAAMTDFSAVTLYNRAYITPHNGTEGLSSQVVKVYDGTTLRSAAGTAPAGTMAAANSATAGNIPAGVHAYGVLFETDTGFFTQIAGFVQLNSTGNFKVDLSSIPTGPAGTFSRHIVATKTITDFAGDFLNQEWFFVPDGELAGNVATTKTINFYDEDLYESADYLLEVLSTIPAGVGIGVYNSRLMVWGENGANHLVRISQIGEPEVFDAVGGFVATNPNDGAGGVQNTLVSRGQLFIFKEYRTFITQDNDDYPDTWFLDKMDSFLGAYSHSVGVILDANENTITDVAVVGNSAGLWLFDGRFSEVPLSWKIADYWDRINKSKLHTMQVIVDPLKDEIYINIPLDAATAPDRMLVGNYENGMEGPSIKWSTFTFTSLAPTSLSLELDSTTKKSKLRLGSSNGGVHNFTDGQRNDNSNAIPDCQVRFSYASVADGENHYGGIRLKARGTGTLGITIYGPDDVLSLTPTGITLAATSRIPLEREFDFDAFEASVLLDLADVANNYCVITKAQLFANMTGENVPR